jgi:hypothetical protein
VQAVPRSDSGSLEETRAIRAAEETLNLRFGSCSCGFVIAASPLALLWFMLLPFFLSFPQGNLLSPLFLLSSPGTTISRANA